MHPDEPATTPGFRVPSTMYCQRCKKTNALKIEIGNDCYRVCKPCGVYWLADRDLEASLWDASLSKAERWRKNSELLAGMTKIEPERPDKRLLLGDLTQFQHALSKFYYEQVRPYLRDDGADEQVSDGYHDAHNALDSMIADLNDAALTGLDGAPPVATRPPCWPFCAGTGGCAGCATL